MISTNDWWLNNEIDRVNKPSEFTMTSCNSNGRSKNVKNTKKRTRICNSKNMVIVMIVAITITITIAITKMTN